MPLDEILDGDWGILDHKINGLYVIGAWGKGIRAYFENLERLQKMNDKFKIVAEIEHDPYEQGGIKYGRHTVFMEVPKLPWYKRWIIELDMWWNS